MDMPIVIDSQAIFNDVERSFKISAGPGAGKTHWLINHIKNVLHMSNRLGKSRKIACITYTNVAVETILGRLGVFSERVEVTTIHSFLYKHVLKPYLSFIDDSYQLNIELVDGHDDYVFSGYGFIKDWKTKTGQLRIRDGDNNLVVDAWRNIKWHLIEDGSLELKTDYPRKIGGFSITNSSYFEYKKMAWSHGLIHHDDVLFFSYHLIKDYPFILDVLCAKFPYFFIDEFQDTNPIQNSIIRKISTKEVVVGVIGDKAQSIYGFQGARYDHFDNFSLNNMVNYIVPENKRSAQGIIDLLNVIRLDIKQIPSPSRIDMSPTIIIGDMMLALNKASELCDNEICTLSRLNIITNSIRINLNNTIPATNLIEEMKLTDSNKERLSIISRSIQSIEISRTGNYKDAIKNLVKVFSNIDDITARKKAALTMIIFLLDNYDHYCNGSLLSFYEFINNKLSLGLAKFKAGAAKEFYNNHSFKELSACVQIKEESSNNRTIHKAKGAEFDNVLVMIQEERELVAFLMNTDLSGNNDNHRVMYVAFSRAKNRLFINIPTLNERNRIALAKKFPFEIVRV